MPDVVNECPDPTRLPFLQSVFEPSSLATVAKAVSLATEHETQLYVERLSDGWRWSLAHRGASYPLLRITAGSSRSITRKIMIGFRHYPTGSRFSAKTPPRATRRKAAPSSTSNPAAHRPLSSNGFWITSPVDQTELRYGSSRTNVPLVSS